ncbi:peptidoglycan D,D-transpeptidase FtsI family protein [Nitriliruptor alkaliphilus]|uniref:peptidoglycan D,D-transpeptidase FtsI family protein n=1 Tax=Nitriliruptor alkaliphilus TaxID=427918 RepID=UPI00069813F7|nr:penicillin-binding protein 2 [Nitriliruptor alkaliphilus]
MTEPRRLALRPRRPIAPRSGARTMVHRLRWMLGVYLLVALLVVGQLIRIQLVDTPGYADLSASQRARIIELPGDRGRIYDREGDVLATTVQAATIYADPRAFRPRQTPEGLQVPPAADAMQTANQLAPLVGRSAEDLAERLTTDAHFVYLARQLDHEVGVTVRELGLEGVGVLAEPKRVYPAGGLAGQVVGFTGIDGEGLQGLEARYDDLLVGTPGLLTLERAPGGLDIASGTRELIPSEPGTDLVLTLDREVQYVAERAAADVTEEFGAEGASVVVLEVATGDVLAMASVPSFDPNQRGDADASTWRNRAVTDVFEPGSTQKALTIAAAIEEGLVHEDSVMRLPTGITVAGKRFTDATPQPEADWTLTEIMERSSNVGTIELAQRLGPERLEAYLRSFGEGSSTGTGFPGESAGLLMPSEDWWGTSLPTIAIGQGVAVSLVQLANAYATLANDGVAVVPRIVRGTVGDDGRLTPAADPVERRVVSVDTAEQVQRMLETVVSGEHGTGHRAAVEGYQVAGKTGTARKPSADARGYSGEYVATFVGFAPVDDPALVVAVMVDEPRPFYGSIVAAPVFSEVMRAALASRRIQPDGSALTLDDSMLAAREAQRAAAEEASAQAAGPEHR